MLMDISCEAVVLGSLIVVALTVALVCVGFYLGRITRGEAQAPSFEGFRLAEKRVLDTIEDPYFEAMHGPAPKRIPTVKER